MLLVLSIPHAVRTLLGFMVSFIDHSGNTQSKRAFAIHEPIIETYCVAPGDGNVDPTFDQ